MQSYGRGSQACTHQKCRPFAVIEFEMAFQLNLMLTSHSPRFFYTNSNYSSRLLGCTTGWSLKRGGAMAEHCALHRSLHRLPGEVALTGGAASIIPVCTCPHFSVFRGRRFLRRTVARGWLPIAPLSPALRPAPCARRHCSSAHLTPEPPLVVEDVRRQPHAAHRAGGEAHTYNTLGSYMGSAGRPTFKVTCLPQFSQFIS